MDVEQVGSDRAEDPPEAQGVREVSEGTAELQDMDWDAVRWRPTTRVVLGHDREADATIRQRLRPALQVDVVSAAQ